MHVHYYIILMLRDKRYTEGVSRVGEGEGREVCWVNGLIQKIFTKMNIWDLMQHDIIEYLNL